MKNVNGSRGWYKSPKHSPKRSSTADILFATHILLPSSRKEIMFSRRDLSDACFQDNIDPVGGEGSTDSCTSSIIDRKLEALELLEASSDLVPGVYGGGLKT